MTKRDLVKKVADTIGMSHHEVAKVIETILDTMSSSLAESSRLEIRDFGVFETRVRAARTGRNPRTGCQVAVPERRVPVFRPGKKLMEQVAGTANSEREPGTRAATDPPEHTADTIQE